MYELKPVSIFIDIKFSYKYLTNQAKFEDIYQYQIAIDSLLYTTLKTRSNILFIIILLGRYISNSNKKYIFAIKRVFKYLRNLTNFGIKFSTNSNSKYLTDYADSNYINEKSIYKSISKYIFYLVNNPVTF